MNESVNWCTYKSSKFKLIKLLVQSLNSYNPKFRGVNYIFPKKKLTFSKPSSEENRGIGECISQRDKNQ